jgi:hypothetical protein
MNRLRRTLVWRAAIDRAAAGGEAGAAVTPSVLLVRGGHDEPGLALGVIGTF